MAAALFLQTVASADTLTGGAATIDFDKPAWDTLASGLGIGSPALTLGAFFDQAQANARTQSQLLTDVLSSTYTGQTYALNGALVLNLTGRHTQPTTFAYAPGNLAGHTGSIGLGGVARFETLLGPVLFGDYTFQYDSARTLAGGTGWYLQGNIPPAGALFDLLNVSIVESPGTFTISGDLGVSYELANFLFGTPGDTLKDVGNFTFTATTVPEPATFVLLGLGALLPLLRRKK